jgi:hypothetical protein
MSEKLKTLLFMTISSILRKRVTGKVGDMLLALDSKKFWKVSSPVVESMLVYIDFASAENSNAFFGGF